VLVVRPPDYFPPVDHAALLARASRVVLADTFAFSRQAMHNRARVLTAQGPQWVTVPRRHAPIGTALARVDVVDDGWARRHVRSLRTAYGMAPYVDWVMVDVEALLRGPHASLGALAAATTEWALRGLGGTTDVVRASALPGGPATLADVWEVAGRPPVLALADSADRDRAALEPLGGAVEALAFDERPRRQVWPGPVRRVNPDLACPAGSPGGPEGGFSPGLSVLDVLMTYGPDARRALLGPEP
jgi:hypothetical protein